ncbi:BnaC08g44920D [Brassica napus]|uniref:BnaC08g44920D protein n=3 Tax=Brassica TaxID=3705 RepID=A0A078FAA7_BRANA|nr:BnaC08g44920D [Brassica napus]
MECFHRCLMDMFKERREASLHWSSDVLVPSAESRMLAAIAKSRGHRVYRANEAEFEVMDSEGNVVVDVEKRSCLCGRWEVYGLPCSHAVGALLSCGEDVYEYAESCFTMESYRRTYGDAIEPVSDNVEWREKVLKIEGGGDGIRTPKVTGGARKGRRRIRPVDDGDRVKRLVHCSRCQQTGHFRTTCIAPM